MGLPKQVRQQIADATRIEKELRAEATAAAATPVAVVTEPVLSQPTPAPQPAAAASVPPSPAPAPQPAPDQKYEELVQQYRTLQGIHRTLVRTNSEQLSAMQEMRNSLKEVTDQLEAFRRQSAQAAAPVLTPVTPEEIKEFGPDLISVIERKAQEVAAPLNQMLREVTAKAEALTARNAELEHRLTGVSDVQTQATQDAFNARMFQLVPDISTLNHDRGFLAWLSQVDPLDARKRTLQQRLTEAVEFGDAEAAASYFTAYKQLVKAAPAAPNAKLAAQAQPASRAAPDATPIVTGKVWTQAEITAFYDGVTRGKYSPQEKSRIEGDIYKAQGENRIAAA